VRLTLRTLLAYLDDMLDPAETKLIGQKVAESDHAQELIARIKQVTRRRRLTTPPATGPNAFEPNTVAEYLDNTLPPEQIAEVEKACLESDVHLAEIAAAHQILTLVLGQPALVPPTAKQRMYALVHGRPAARARPAAAAAATPNGAAPESDARAEDDETLLLGLPFYRRQAAMRWLLPLAAVLLLAVLAVAIYEALPLGLNGTPIARAPDNTAPAGPADDGDASKEDQKRAEEARQAEERKKEEERDREKARQAEEARLEEARLAEERKKKPPVVRPQPPSQDRREVGRYRLPVPAGTPNILVSRAAASPAKPWQRLKSEDRVFTTDALLSLPGYHSDLRLESGVELTLWGSTYEFNNLPILESAVVLHAAPKDFDADLTLERGAIKLTNRKDTGEAAVRIRFQGEVWDVRLAEKDSEVGVTLFSRHVLPYGTGEGPQADLHLFVLKGRAAVRVTPFEEFDNIQKQEGALPYVLFWDNKGRGTQRPVPAQDRESWALLGVFSRPLRAGLPEDVQTQIEETYRALAAVSARLSGPGRIETGLVEMLQAGETPLAKGQLLNAILAVRCLGALDAIADVVNILGDEQMPPALRDEAINTLRHWCGRNDSMEARLFDPNTRTGILTEGTKYRASEAAIIMELLHSPSKEQLLAPAFWAYLIDKLRYDKLAIRELAFYHLRHLVAQWRTIMYNTTDTPEGLQRGYEAWKKLIPEGKLPPPPPQRPPA